MFQTINLTRKYIQLHSLFADKIHNLMIKSTIDGTPVNLPIWWLDPHDRTAFTIDSGPYISYFVFQLM